jgi:O-antigen/teichoic acid export membrane protein
MRSVYIGRAELIISTGMPGLYRLMTFFAIQHIYTLADLGSVASNMAIAQIVAFFTAIGWATLILVRVSGAADLEEAKGNFYNILWMALCVTVVSSACVLAFAFLGFPSSDIKAIVELLWSWSLYQLFRHFFVAQKRYRSLIIFDVVLTALSIIVIWLSKAIWLTPSDALSGALFIISLCMMALIGLPTGGVRFAKFEKKGLEFGMANFVSGGMVLSLSPLSTFLCGPAFAGVFSLINSISTFGALVPRAISLSQLPVLAKKKVAGEPLAALVSKMRSRLICMNGAVLTGNIIILVGMISYKNLPGISQYVAIGVAVLMSLLYATGASAITHSNILMIFENSRMSLIINIQAALIFLIISSGVAWVGNEIGIWFLLISAILLTICKNIRVVRMASRDLLIYESELEEN